MQKQTRRRFLTVTGGITGTGIAARQVRGRPGQGNGNSGRGSGGTSHVSPGESIQDAVDNAPAGSRIVLKPGTYRQQVIVRKDLTLVGEGDVTIVPPSGKLRNVSLLRPLVGAAGTDTAVTIENISVDGENRGSGGFYTGIGFFEADGSISGVTVERTDYGGFVTQNLGGGGDQDVSVEDSQFSDLGFQPLVFNERGTTGRVTNTTLVGTPGTVQYGLTAGFGASVDVKRSTFRDFYQIGGFGIGFYGFDSSDNTVIGNSFENVQYPTYLLADASSDFSSSAGFSRVVRNEFTGTEIPGAATSYGTTIYANDPQDDETTETANNVKVVNNEYADLDFGVATFTVGDGVVQNTKIINNTFDNVDTAITDNGEATKQAANRIE